jgi:hypothetical protein
MVAAAAFRSIARITACVALIGLFGCQGISPGGFSGDVDVLLTRGEAYVNHLAAQPAERLSDAEIIALGYIERGRLGLGSPFRLIEYALRDPDLPEQIREPLAYGLLAKGLHGRTYFVDPGVLDLVRLTGVPPERGSGLQQLRLIERAIAAAPSATSGERTVRLGYLLASTERTLDPGHSSVVAHVGALIADRRRVQEDASLLLRTAARRQEDPLLLLQDWRRQLRFRVEQPALALASPRDEEAEARDGPPLALALRTLAQRMSAPVSFVNEAAEPVLRDQRSVLDGEAAARLQALTEARNYPPQAPVAVAVAINRDGLVSRAGLEPWQREAREQFAENAWNEERLVAAAAVLRTVGAHQGQRLALIQLQAATFLRVWNQEDPWIPGDAGPNARDLEARFGFAAIRFDEEIPDAWRSYFLRMIGRSMADLQRVVPTISARGLTIHVGEVPGGILALALHEPRTRTLYLPPRTGAGTLAHEIAHDLDWQLARRRYGARGGYATDMAVRDNRGDRIAVAMMELSASLVQPVSDSPLSPHATRPAEVFARGMDWLVAAILARDGRLGGYLTSFQDPVLTGYGTTRGPDISGGAVPALYSILDVIAPVVDPTREWILEMHGPNRNLSPIDHARTVTAAGAGLAPEERFQEIQRVAARSFGSVSDCRLGSPEGLRRLVSAQRTLAAASLDAAARGAAIDAVRALAYREAGPRSTVLVDAWLGWRLYGAPEPVDPLLEELAPAFDDLLMRAGLLERDSRIPVARSAFYLGEAPTLCRGNPFAAIPPVSRLRGSISLAE